MNSHLIDIELRARAKRHLGIEQDQVSNFLVHAGLCSDDLERLNKIGIERLIALYLMYCAGTDKLTAAQALKFVRE